MPSATYFSMRKLARLVAVSYCLSVPRILSPSLPPASSKNSGFDNLALRKGDDISTTVVRAMVSYINQTERRARKKHLYSCVPLHKKDVKVLEMLSKNT